MKRTMTIRNLISYFVLGCALAACSGIPPKTVINHIQVLADIDANQNSATALDIVFVYDSNALGLLPKTGPEWFNHKSILINTLATSMDLVSIEIPPGTTVALALPKNYEKAIAVYSFANYVGSAGQPMGNLTPFKNMTIHLTSDTIQYLGN